jgi:hypothetical protein
MLGNAPSQRVRRVAAVAGAAVLGAGLVLSAPQAAMAAPTAQTSYSFTSESGDYIGAGRTAGYTAPPATINLSGGADYVRIFVSSGNDDWSIDIAAPRGEKLHPGTYNDAERASFRTGRSPGLDVSGDGRGCNEVWGQFAIDQIETDAAGAVTVFEARFVQRCESATAAKLNGTVKFRALPLSYHFASDSGDYIGGGVTKNYTGATSIFNVQGTTSDLYFTVSGQRDDWTVELAPAPGEQLKVGTYNNAVRVISRGAGQPGLDVYGDGRGCNALTGSFKITELVADSTGAIKALAATYEQHCEGGAPALKGTVHYYA